jgi:hypothetical protein
MAHAIEYPADTKWFIARPADGVGILATGTVSPEQVMDTGLAIVETYDTEEAFNAAVAAVGFRVLLLVPEGLELSALTTEAIASVFGQYVMPKPGTVAVDGTVICDAVTTGNFEPETMAGFGMTCPIIGMWNAFGEEIIPLEVDTYTAHRVDGTVVDGHNWAGWPECF